MKPPRKPSVFLERRAYHKRRMRDLARAVPIFGVVLWGMPLLWREDARNSDAVVYVFAVWFLLIALAALISKAVKSDDVPPTGPT